MRKGRPPILIPLCIFLLGQFVPASFAFGQKNKIAIIYNQQNNSYQFTSGEMKKTLEKEGYTVTLAGIENIAGSKAPSRIILTTRGTNEADKFLKQPGIKALPGSESQGYSVRKQTSGGSNDWYIIGYDYKGVIYGGLDVSETIQLKGMEALADADKVPYIASRGIKFNIPLDARTPSYSDNSDAGQKNIANVWDANFWHEFIDEMARDRFNLLSFWSLAPFPSLVDVPEYPNAGLQDVKKNTIRAMATTDAWYMSSPASLSKLETVKKITLAEKIKFWNGIMQYANDRGIECYLFTWNLFTYGTENSGYGFTDKITDPKTKDYIRKATKALIKAYPLLKGIGLTAGENMYRLPEADKEKFLYESYGLGINDALEADPSRKFKLIHRAHQADIEIIKTAFAGLNTNCEMSFSYKYSVAQMYSAVAPKYIYESEFLEHIGDSKFFLTLRDDALYNLRGGSDPAFAREYFKSIPKKNLDGFYLGPDGYSWGREYLSKSPSISGQLVLKKRWYSFRINGKLAYDPQLPDAYFTNLLAKRFREVNGKDLFEAWAKASQVMPLINRFHNEKAQNDFQWYPEACTSFYGFRGVDNFINSAPQKGEGLASIPDYSKAMLNGKLPEGITPVAVAAEFQKNANRALLLVKGMTNIMDTELKETIADIKAMALLGQYYSKKILGATNKDLFDKTTDPEQKEKYKHAAINNLEDAAKSWKEYAAQVTSTYTPQYLTRMHFTVDFKAMQANVDKEAAMFNTRPIDGGFNTTPPIQQLEVVFSNYSKFYYWHLDKLGLPANWSDTKSLVLEVFATTRQPFDLFLQTANDTLVSKDIHPVTTGWNRIIIPLETFRAAVAIDNKEANSYSPASKEDVLLNEVLLFGVTMHKPMGYPVLEIRSIKMSNENAEKRTALSHVIQP